MVKRLVDVGLCLVLMGVSAIPMVIIGMAVKLSSTGPIIFWSSRIGIDNCVFRMPKFRTMRVDAPNVATHLLDDPERFLIPIGRILRKTSLDELPQLFSVLRGDMSFVGPRPALFNQADLIALRTAKGVHRIVPGITGWAQINGRDELPIPQKVEYDTYYLRNQTLAFDIRVMLRTVFNVLRREGVNH